MRPLTRVAAAGLVVGSLAGALALRPASASSSPRPADEAAVQSLAVSTAQASAAQAALSTARELAATRHLAYLRSKAAQAELLAARRAARPAVVTKPVSTVRPKPAVHAAARESYLARGTRIYRSFHYDVRKLGYRIVFKPSVHGLLGLTDGGTRTITVYVRGSESDLVLAHSIAHEMGHALDFSRGSEAKHALYLSIRHLNTKLNWYGCNNCTDYSTPAGDWAEVFAQWLAGPGDFRSRMAGVPSRAQLRQLAPLFRL